MSDSELYRRALVRFAISLILTIAGALICPVALYPSFGNSEMFALILLLMVPWAWTLSNIWRHALSDVRRVQDIVAVREYEQRVAVVHRSA
ncbi:MAG TPA: hypothetical protein VFN62_09560 [Acidobacteriaceae bacterium]|nr:hypothetical protein [Acidobacteriaceae bacterium]